MNIKIVNFEQLSKSYRPYQDGITEISNTKKSFIEKLDPFKEEMEKIIARANAGEQIEPATEQRFNELQNLALEIDEEFKKVMRDMNDTLSKTIYGELCNIINEWSLTNAVDLVIGSTEVVFLKPEHEITDEILSKIKENGLYILEEEIV